MGKQEELNNVNSMVYQVLVECPKARDSDEYLVAKILEKVLLGSEKEYKAIYLMENFYNITGFHIESVRRSRQKIQAENPKLWSSKRIRAYRKKNILEVLKYLKAKGNKDNGQFCVL